MSIDLDSMLYATHAHAHVPLALLSIPADLPRLRRLLLLLLLLLLFASDAAVRIASDGAVQVQQ